MSEPANAKPRGRGWKILGVVVAVIVGCVAALFLWVSVVSGRKLDQMGERTKAMADEWKARPAERPVLRGKAEPGNAWDDYTPALTAIKGTKDISKLGMVVTRDPKGDPEFAKAMLANHAKALDGLRRGASRATARYPYDWDSGANAQMPGLLASQSLANLAVLQARALAESGKPGEAAGVLLDLLQFGGDIGRDGVVICEMIGAALLQLGLTEARDLLRANVLDSGALRDLEAGLATLDGSFTVHGRVLSNEAIFAGMELRREAGAANVFTRLLHTSTFDRAVDTLDRLSKAESLPWKEIEVRRTAIEAELKSDWNPITRMMMPGMGGTSRVTRHRLVQLRTLRTAIHQKAGGDRIELDDPFGTTLKSSGAGDTFKVWSVGPDGVDDGGAGDWTTNGRDIVLDLGKK